MSLPGRIEAGPVTLVRWRPELVPGLAGAFARAEPDLRAWMPSAANEQEDAGAFVDACVALFDAGTTFAYAVVDGDDDEGPVVGYANATVDGPTATLAMWVVPERRRRGVATAVLRSLAAATFAAVPSVAECAAQVDAANAASRSALTAAGMSCVGQVHRHPRTPAESDVELRYAVARPG